MLQVLRDSMKYLAWILWVVIAIFVLFVFVDFGRSSRYDRNSHSQTAATVGNQAISYREYEHAYRNLEDRYRQQLGEQYTSELAQQLRLPMQALNQLVMRKIMLREAARLDLQVSDVELRRYIASLPLFQDADGKFVGADVYQRVVRSRIGETPETFEASMREDLVLQRLYGALRRAVVVTDQDVEERYRQQAEKVKLRYVAIPFAASVGQLEVSDAELQKWFDQHREQYRVPEQRVADYLLVDQSAVERSLPIGEQELRDYFAQHKDEYGQPEQVHARHILVATPAAAATAQTRLAAGEDFAKVAREMSTDTQSAAQGGDLGWFGKGRMVPPFEEAAFSAPLGKLVGPVQTQFGYHLIEVQERRAATTSSFDEVKGAVRVRLAAERAASEAEAKAKGLAAQLKQAGGNVRQKMQELANQPGVELGTTEPFSRQGPVQPLGMSPALNAAAFKLQKGGVAEPQRTPRGWVVLHLAEVKPPHLPPLAEVKEAVRRGAEQDKKRQQAFERLQAARAKVGPAAGLDAIAAELGLTVQESQEFGYGAVIPGLGYAPDLAREVMGKPVGTFGGPTAVAGSAVLYQISARQGFDPAVYAQQKEGLREQLEQEQLNGLVSSLINARKQEMGVTYDPALLKMMGIEGQQPAERG